MYRSFGIIHIKCRVRLYLVFVFRKDSMKVNMDKIRQYEGTRNNIIYIIYNIYTNLDDVFSATFILSDFIQIYFHIYIYIIGPPRNLFFKLFILLLHVFLLSFHRFQGVIMIASGVTFDLYSRNCFDWVVSAGVSSLFLFSFFFFLQECTVCVWVGVPLLRLINL